MIKYLSRTTNQIVHCKVNYKLFWIDLSNVCSSQGHTADPRYIRQNVLCSGAMSIQFLSTHYSRSNFGGQRNMARGSAAGQGWMKLDISQFCLNMETGGMRKNKCNQNHINYCSIILWPVTNRKNSKAVLHMWADKEKKMQTMIFICFLPFSFLFN